MAMQIRSRKVMGLLLAWFLIQRDGGVGIPVSEFLKTLLFFFLVNYDGETREF